MIHEGQRLAFGFEPGDDLPGVHSQLDDLEGNRTPNRLLLFGHIDRPEAALADELENLVMADDRPRPLRQRRVGRRCVRRVRPVRIRGRDVLTTQETPRFLFSRQQRFYFRAQCNVVPALAVQKLCLFLGG